MKPWKPFKRDDDAVGEILDLIYGYQKSRTLFTAIELDVFDIIGADKKSSDEIAVLINADKEAVKKFLNALCAMNLLEKIDDKYQNTNLSMRFLVKSKPEYIGLMEWNALLWRSWGALTESIKTGEPAKEFSIPELRGKEAKAFIDAAHWRSSLLAKEIVSKIDLRNVERAMDLGGGVGDYAIEFVKSKPSMKADIFTYPNLVSYAAEYLKYEEKNISSAIEIKVGDMLEDDIGSGYDLIFLSFVVQNFDIWQNIDLMKKIYDALNPGGQVVIQDYFINEDRISPEFNAIYNLELGLITKGAQIYACADIWFALKEAWLDDVRKVDTEFGTSLIFAKKR